MRIDAYQSEKVHLERMSTHDLNEVMAIERDSFSSPWSREGFRQEVINRERSLSLVARIEDNVVGYGVAWIVADEIYIGNLAVHRLHRRKGIGELLLRSLLKEGLARDCDIATLEVRQTNWPAIELYSKFGFFSVAFRKGYYRDTGEDAVVMIKNLRRDCEASSRPDLVDNGGR
jgi:ribosomal-protein-alanine N-acetyltransferase